MPTASELDQQLDLFFGAASEATCRVYARLERLPGVDRAQLTGTLTGPTCQYAQTLPATYSFVDRGPGPTLLAEAVVPEPCFWTPELPHLYRADVQLRAGGKVLAQVRRTFGIRPLGVGRGQLVYGGQNWVLRGVFAEELPKTDLAAWHEAETAICMRNPDNSLCDSASRVGVLVVAELVGSEVHEIRRLRRWPAVGIITVKSAAKLELRGLSHNAILAQRFAPGQPLDWAGWSEAAVCEVIDADTSPGGVADHSMTLIAHRPAGPLETVADGRAACDRLQRDLARHGQFAGYIV